MSKHEDFKTILDEISDLNLLNLLWKNVDDQEAEKQSLRLIRVFRQYIERLRRIVDDEQPPVEVRSLQDAMKLNRDELAYLAWQFFQWLNGDDCPADTCKDFPCHYRQEVKAECEENL